MMNASSFRVALASCCVSLVSLRCPVDGHPDAASVPDELVILETSPEVPSADLTSLDPVASDGLCDCFHPSLQIVSPTLDANGWLPICTKVGSQGDVVVTVSVLPCSECGSETCKLNSVSIVGSTSGLNVSTPVAADGTAQTGKEYADGDRFTIILAYSPSTATPQGGSRVLVHVDLDCRAPNQGGDFWVNFSALAAGECVN